MRSIAVINQKGGVGKTTTTANIAHAIALKGKHVTVIDLDPQGHLSAHFGITNMNNNGIDQILFDNANISKVAIDVRKGLKLIPPGKDLVRVERAEDTSISSTELEKIISEDLNSQDFVFIDCPPASGLLIDYALTTVKEIMIPVAGDYLSLRGLSDLVATIKRFEKMYKKEFKQWIVITRYHLRRKLSREVHEKLLEYFPGAVLATLVRETAALAECPSFGKTVFEYKKGNNGALDYKKLAKNFLNGQYYGNKT